MDPLDYLLGLLGYNSDTELVNNIDQNIEFFLQTAVETRLVLTVPAYEMCQIQMRTFFQVQFPKAVVLKVNGATKKSYIPIDFVKKKKFEFAMGNDGQLIINETPR